MIIIKFWCKNVFGNSLMKETALRIITIPLAPSTCWGIVHWYVVNPFLCIAKIITDGWLESEISPSCQNIQSGIPRPFSPVPTEYTHLGVSLALQFNTFNFTLIFFSPDIFFFDQLGPIFYYGPVAGGFRQLLTSFQWLNRELFSPS